MKTRGFTLIEMLVSVAVFSMVMVVALGALLSLSEANRKAQLLSEATNNFNSAIDSMTRSIRTGTSYHCGGGVVSTAQDCTNGSTEFAFLPAGASARTVYEYSTSGCTDNGPGCIVRSQDGGSTFAPITSSDIVVTSLQFYVVGAPSGVQSPQSLSIQPKVEILIAGYITLKSGQTTAFNVQTSVTQRIYDQ